MQEQPPDGPWVLPALTLGFAVQFWGGSSCHDPTEPWELTRCIGYQPSSSPRLVYFLHILRSLMGTRCLALGPVLVYK